MSLPIHFMCIGYIIDGTGTHSHESVYHYFMLILEPVQSQSSKESAKRTELVKTERGSSGVRRGKRNGLTE